MCEQCKVQWCYAAEGEINGKLEKDEFLCGRCLAREVRNMQKAKKAEEKKRIMEKLMGEIAEMREEIIDSREELERTKKENWIFKNKEAQEIRVVE